MAVFSPKITVIVPVYNAEETLVKCLDSLMMQQFPGVEFLCVDDGSKDNSYAILQQYAQQDARFRVFTKENGGVSTARNFGLDHATGEFIMFLDSDDWFAPDACQLAYRLITEADADVLLFGMQKEYVDSVSIVHNYGDEEVLFSEEECRLLHRQSIGLVGKECRNVRHFDGLSEVYVKVYRREIIEREHIRFYDIRKIGSFEDGFFNVEYLAFVNKCLYTPKILYHYNKTNSSSITTKYRPNLNDQWTHLFTVLSGYISRYDNAEYAVALNNRIANAIIGLGLNVLASSMTFKEKRKAVKKLLNSEYLHRAYSNEEIASMPIYFGVFFTFSKWRWTFGVYLLLMAMSYIRNRNKGI